MAITVVDDYTTIAAFECCTGKIAPGLMTIGMCPDTAVKVEGCASMPGKPGMCGGVGGIGFNNVCATIDITDEHIMGWGRSLDFVVACAGAWRIRTSASICVLEPTCYGDYEVGSICSSKNTLTGFISFAADARKPYFFVCGTPPGVCGIQTVSVMSNVTSGGGKCSSFVDEIKRGTGITVTGGTCTPRGSVEIAADDTTVGRGTFVDTNGVFFVRGRITIGDVTASTNSSFDDDGKVWNFESVQCAVASTWHKVIFVGGTGTNRATFGNRSGCGTAREGFGGNTFIAGGNIPFRFEAVCSSVTVEMYGNTFIGPTCLYDDHLQNFKVEDNCPAAFVCDTTDANNSTVCNACFFPACPAACDSANFGMNERFSFLKINTGTAGTGTYTVIWEYSRCAGWTALTDVTDGTTNFKTTGCQTVSYTIPDDRIATCVGCDTRYWIRARIDCGTTTVDPVMTQVKASLGGGIRLEHSGAEMIRSVITNMDVVRIRCGALLKKSIIQCSVAPAKSAAIDIGGADPATDTFRDLTVQNNINGILLKGSGCVTYNFRNILFSCNTQDVRVDFAMCDTVTINILECGDTPSTCNVNCSTITINNNVCVLVTVLDVCGNGVPCATVGIFDSPVCIGEAALFCGTTNACGIFCASHSLMCDVTVSTRVRKKGFISTDTAGTINMCGLCVPVTFIADSIVNLP